MRSTTLIALLMVTLCVGAAQAQVASAPGRFIGTVQAEWLDDGRAMRLQSTLTYIDPAGLEWYAPAGAKRDGASIPRFAWSIIGGPFEGRYRSASVIHDVACDVKKRPWTAVHEAFYFAMLTSGVELVKAKVMYAAVYHFGPRWATPTPGGILGGGIDLPTPRTLVESDFDRLRATIEAGEHSGARMSLSDVRDFRP